MVVGEMSVSVSGKPCVDFGNRVRVPRIRPAVRAGPLRNVDFPCVFKVSSGSGTGSRARKPLADSGSRVRIFTEIVIDLVVIRFFEGFRETVQRRHFFLGTRSGKLRNTTFSKWFYIVLQYSHPAGLFFLGMPYQALFVFYRVF